MSDYLKDDHGDLFARNRRVAVKKLEPSPEERAWRTFRFMLLCAATMQQRGMTDEAVDRYVKWTFLHLWRPTPIFGQGRDVFADDFAALGTANKICARALKLRLDSCPAQRAEVILREDFFDLWKTRR